MATGTLAEERKRPRPHRAQLAAAMGVPRPVSPIERGEIATIDAVARYIEALGGRPDLVASFGDRTPTVITTEPHDGSTASPEVSHSSAGTAGLTALRAWRRPSGRWKRAG